MGIDKEVEVISIRCIEDDKTYNAIIIDRLEHNGHTYVLVGGQDFIDGISEKNTEDFFDVFVLEEKVDENGDPLLEGVEEEFLDEELFKLFETKLSDNYEFLP